MSEKDFFRLFNLIERVAMLELRQLRCENQSARGDCFKESMKDAKSDSMKAYLKLIKEHCEREVEEVERVQNEVLLKFGVEEDIWNASVHKFLLDDGQYIEAAVKNSFKSPFIEETKIDLAQEYKKAVDFALSTIKDLKNELPSIHGQSDVHERVLIIDYLITDWFLLTHSLTSTQLKSAVDSSSSLDLSSTIKHLAEQL